MKRSGGWQFKIKYFPNYVLKTPRTYAELRRRAYPWLKSKGKTEKEIDNFTKKVFNDVKTSTKIINESKCPAKLLGNPIFLKKRVRQKRAVMFESRIKRLTIKKKKKEVKENIDNIVKLILELWKYGIHENTYNFSLNYGFIKKRAILVDLFEITDNKESVIKQIKKKKWKRNTHMSRDLKKEDYAYLIKQCNKSLTLKNLEKLWKINSS